MRKVTQSKSNTCLIRKPDVSIENITNETGNQIFKINSIIDEEDRVYQQSINKRSNEMINILREAIKKDQLTAVEKRFLESGCLFRPIKIAVFGIRE